MVEPQVGQIWVLKNLVASSEEPFFTHYVLLAKHDADTFFTLHVESARTTLVFLRPNGRWKLLE